MAESKEVDEVVVLKLSTGEQKQVVKEARKVWRYVYGAFRTRTCPRIDLGLKRKALSKCVCGAVVSFLFPWFPGQSSCSVVHAFDICGGI